ncbi:MAG: hypothetical protein ACREBU_24210, partial [Nitrososphaera sp.]
LRKNLARSGLTRQAGHNHQRQTFRLFMTLPRYVLSGLIRLIVTYNASTTIGANDSTFRI